MDRNFIRRDINTMDRQTAAQRGSEKKTGPPSYRCERKGELSAGACGQVSLMWTGAHGPEVSPPTDGLLVSGSLGYLSQWQ